MRAPCLTAALFACATLLGSTPECEAAVLSGVVESVGENHSSVTLKLRNGLTRPVQIQPDAKVTYQRKPVTLADVAVGDKIALTTTRARVAYKITILVKAENAPPTPPANTPDDSSTPEPTTNLPEKMTRETDEPGTAGGAENPAGVNKLAGANANSGGDTWTQFRGPRRDNRSGAQGLATNWSASAPKPVWGAMNLGEGYSSVSVADGKVFTLGTQNGKEVVFALPLQGRQEVKPLWTAPTGGGVYSDGQGNGPRSTPTIDGDKLYALGAEGDLVCLNVSDGSQVWHTNILSEFGGKNIVWGISESPLVDGEHVIVTPGGQQGTMVKLNKADGSLVWACQVPGNPKASYSSPIIVTTGDVKQYVTFVHDRTIGVRASDGKLLWENNTSANGTANCSAPVADGPYVFTASGYNTGGTCVKLTASGDEVTAKEVYHTDDMENHHGGMVIVDGHVYGTDGNILTCIELATGTKKWQARSVGKGAITYADGMLILRSERGPVALAKATPEGYEELGQLEQPYRSDRNAWAHPVVTDGKLFLRDWDKLLVYDVSGR